MILRELPSGQALAAPGAGIGPEPASSPEVAPATRPAPPWPSRSNPENYLGGVVQRSGRSSAIRRDYSAVAPRGSALSVASADGVDRRHPRPDQAALVDRLSRPGLRAPRVDQAAGRLSQPPPPAAFTRRSRSRWCAGASTRCKRFDLHRDDALVRPDHRSRGTVRRRPRATRKIQTALHARDRSVPGMPAPSPGAAAASSSPAESCAGKSDVGESARRGRRRLLTPMNSPCSMWPAGSIRIRCRARIRAVARNPRPDTGRGVWTAASAAASGPGRSDRHDVSYEPGGSLASRSALAQSRALLALIENTVAARQPPGRTMPILRQMVLTARAIHSRRE